MTQLFVEILSEEIPARMQQKGAMDFKELMTKRLRDEGLTYDTIKVLYSPRRLALVIDGLPAQTETKTIERKGPRVDAPSKAIEGFLASTGLSIEQCERRTLPKGDFLFAVIEEEKRQTKDILPKVIHDGIKSISWPNTMRWASGTDSWIRPVHGIIALFGETTLPLTLSFGDDQDRIKAGSTTTGHRFMSPDAFSVSDFKDYIGKLKNSFVMVDPDQRRAKIMEDAEALVHQKGLRLRRDASLLEEVTGLVEWPVVLMGRIEERFMALPPEILSTSMKVHQRYFSVEDSDGHLAPYFIFVANVEAFDKGQTIIAGNERVLGARLSDAAFFWDQDRKKPLEELLPRLELISFHEKLGTLAEKGNRLESLTGALARNINISKEKACHAARLCKADLVTEMVYEFPELQGTMGGYYAAAEGISSEVATAIKEHYKPRGAGDDCPQSTLGAVLALADRLDTLVGFFAVGLRPTGSKDPFALRRAVLGIIRLQEEGIDLTFDQLVQEAYPLYKTILDGISEVLSEKEVMESLKSFYQERLKVYWKDRGHRQDVINAVMASGLSEPLGAVKKRLVSLETFLEDPDGAGKDLLIAYKRAANILEAANFQEYDPGFLTSCSSNFTEEAEKKLWATLEKTAPEVDQYQQAGDYKQALSLLADLREPLDTYFDQVTVNADDPKVRQSRLGTLARFRVLMRKIADFSQID